MRADGFSPPIGCAPLNFTPVGFELICLSVTLIKKENLIFLIYKEIQSGAVAKLYMREGLPNI